MEYWLGIDCGGTFIKAGLYDRDGNECGIARQNLAIISPQPGWAERDMNVLWHAMTDVIRQLLARQITPPSHIQGLGISAQGKGLFLLDKQGKPLGNAILSSDQRALAIVKQWQQDGIPQMLYPTTRQTLWTGHPVSLLRWLKVNQAARYQQIGSVLMAHDYLRYRLTDQLGCEETNISESNLYSMAEGGYHPALAQLLGIEEIVSALPPIVGATDIVGTLTQAASDATGLPVGLPVVGGLFDIVSTALCAGLKDQSRLNAVMGTWAVTSGIADQLQSDLEYPFVYGRYAETGQYIVHEASPTSAANLDWFIQQWLGNEARTADYRQINQWIAALPKVSSSLLFVPFLYGSNAKLGMCAGFYGMQSFHQRPHLAQAIYEGVVFSHMTHLNRMRKRFPEVCALRITGGPAQSPQWMQMFSDISGLPVELPQVEETGCLGASLAAMVGTGRFADFREAQQAITPKLTIMQPDPLVTQAYHEKYLRYQALVAALGTLH